MCCMDVHVVPASHGCEQEGTCTCSYSAQPACTVFMHLHSCACTMAGYIIYHISCMAYGVDIIKGNCANREVSGPLLSSSTSTKPSLVLLRKTVEQPVRWNSLLENVWRISYFCSFTAKTYISSQCSEFKQHIAQRHHNMNVLACSSFSSALTSQGGTSFICTYVESRPTHSNYLLSHTAPNAVSG